MLIAGNAGEAFRVPPERAGKVAAVVPRADARGLRGAVASVVPVQSGLRDEER